MDHTGAVEEGRLPPVRPLVHLALVFDDPTTVRIHGEAKAEAGFAAQRLIVALDPLRAGLQRERCRDRILERGEKAENMAANLDRREGGQTGRRCRASDHGACNQLSHAVAAAVSTRIFDPIRQMPGLNTQGVDEDAVAWAESLDGTLALLTNAADLHPAVVAAGFKSLVNIELRSHVLKRNSEIGPFITGWLTPWCPSPDLLSCAGPVLCHGHAPEATGHPASPLPHGPRPARTHPEAHRPRRKPHRPRHLKISARATRPLRRNGRAPERAARRRADRPGRTSLSEASSRVAGIS